MNRVLRNENTIKVELLSRNVKFRGSKATRFLQLLSQVGGATICKTLIEKDGETYGSEVLQENKRLDLSVEALVLKPKYKELFTDVEKTLCQKRLLNFGYSLQDYYYDRKIKELYSQTEVFT